MGLPFTLSLRAPSTCMEPELLSEELNDLTTKRFITAGAALTLALLVTPTAAAAPVADSADTHLSVRAPKAPAPTATPALDLKDREVSLDLNVELTVRAPKPATNVVVDQPKKFTVPQLQLIDPAPPAPTTTVQAPPPAPVASSSSSATGSSSIAAVPLSSTGNAAVDAAMSRMGDPYVWGGMSPGGFDCSGLTSWAHAQAGKSIPRTSQAQIANGTPVSLDSLQPGDLIGYYSGVTHVAMYIGNGQVVHASTYGVPVGVADLYHAPISGAVRY